MPNNYGIVTASPTGYYVIERPIKNKLLFILDSISTMAREENALVTTSLLALQQSTGDC